MPRMIRQDFLTGPIVAQAWDSAASIDAPVCFRHTIKMPTATLLSLPVTTLCIASSKRRLRLVPVDHAPNTALVWLCRAAARQRDHARSIGRI